MLGRISVGQEFLGLTPALQLLIINDKVEFNKFIVEHEVLGMMKCRGRSISRKQARPFTGIVSIDILPTEATQEDSQYDWRGGARQIQRANEKAREQDSKQSGQ